MTLKINLICERGVHMLAFYKKSVPLTIGLIISLLALSNLINDGGDGDILRFLIFSVFGFPTLFYGINRISEKQG